MTRALILTAVLLLAAPASAEAPDLAAARASTAGSWEGELQYRDYQSDRWIGIPVRVKNELVDDGITIIRRASFDDGPDNPVYITLVNMLDADRTTDFVGSFRAGRPAELGKFEIALAAATDEQNWTIVASQDGMDDNRPARIRETTIRTGDRLVTLKEVDFTDDDKEEWLQRNRTVLKKVESE